MSNEEQRKVSRRKFLKTSGIAAGGVVGGAILGGLFHPFQTKQVVQQVPTKDTDSLQEARMFFRRGEDFETLAAATERIFPKDEHGPGAIELNVPYFIDKQLAGAWGMNNDDYMKGPFDPNSWDTHGYQTKLNRAEVFLTGLRRIQEVSQEEYNETFVNLDGEKQDEILKKLESGEVKMKGVTSDAFFSLLRQATIEGVYADPVYGGNKDMQGWKMMEYPGPRMSWEEEVEAEDFLSIEPSSLREYQGGGVYDG